MPKLFLADSANHQANSGAHLTLILDQAERLGTGLLQLEAMLCLCYGEGGEAFRCYSDDIQDSYLWSCADKVERLKEQCGALRSLLIGVSQGKEVSA